MRRLICFFILLAPACSASAQNNAAVHPNILIILTDDQGWGDLSVNGNRQLRTPNIDQLASDGTTLDRFFVCPVCSPTRAEFLTGRYFPRTGVSGVSRGAERMDIDEQTIADMLQSAGYRTGAFGKWHNGTQYPYHPNARGFDEYYGFCSGHWGHYWSPLMDHNGEIVQGDGFIIDDLTDHAMDFIRSRGDKPFFCYVPFNTPHSPMQVPDEYWERHESQELNQRGTEASKEIIDHTRAALAMCENIDWNVGRLLATLQEEGVADDTIVIYFSDNGPNGHRWNGGMKGMKGTTDEGGVRSPFFIRWPGKIQAGRVVPQIAGAIDLLPTLAELVGIQRTGSAALDGMSLKPLLLNESADWPDRMIVSHWNKGLSVRSQRFRLDNDGQLFDMVNDSDQTQNVAGEFADVTAALTSERRRYEQTVLTEYLDEPRPFIVGHSSGRTTQLPARDATSTGAIKRSNRHPNSSHFTNWTSTKETIDWLVDVAESGVYSAEIKYTCRPENQGAVIRLEADAALGDAHVQAPAKAFESEMLGHKEDRYLRREGFEQHWGTMNLGEISLRSGRGTLQLKAVSIPGDAAIDFRLLLLHRKE